MAHTDLDAAKIEANGDFAAAGLEAYSRAVESRAWRVLERVEELLAVDDEAKGGKADDRAKGVRWEEDLPAPWADEQGDRVCGERVEGGDSVDSGSLWSSVGEQVGFLRGRGDRGGARTRRSGRSAV